MVTIKMHHTKKFIRVLALIAKVSNVSIMGLPENLQSTTVVCFVGNGY